MRGYALSFGAMLLGAALIGPAQAQYAQRRSLVIPMYSDMQATWKQVDGCAKRITVAEPGHPFVTGCGSNDATQVFYLNNAGVFEPVPGSAVSIATMPTSSSDPRRYYGIGTSGQASPGLGVDVCVKEIGMGKSTADPNVTWTWVMVCPTTYGAQDFPIARRNSSARIEGGGLTPGSFIDPSFNYYPGAGVRLAVGHTDSVAWVVNSQGAIWRQNYCKGGDADESVSGFCKSVADGWEQIPGCARSIGNGGSNRVWVIGCDPDANGNSSIYQYSGASDGGPIAASRWIKRAGRGKEIAVDVDGRPWVIRADGTIWQWSAGVPGKREALPSDPAMPTGANPN